MDPATDPVTAFAPGRVNLMGDHTDHTGGLCLPMALTMGVTVRGRRAGALVALRSDAEAEPAEVDLGVDDPAGITPSWARYVAGVVAEVRPPTGFAGTVDSDLPIGAGLSSSAALEVATALALGATGTPLEVAELCQRAEQRASGVPCGILDQLTSTSGVAGHALVMDCTELTTTPVAVPDAVDIVVVHSGQQRTLAGSDYAVRRAECEAAERVIGPLRRATIADVNGMDDPVLRRRARHVVTENERVVAAADALRRGDVATLALVFRAGHASLRDDFACSTPTVDVTVERLEAVPGVHAARMTGGGWGGCVVALAEPGALVEGWNVRPGGPAGLVPL